MKSCESPMFSVVVPMYNVEQYLVKCVESLLAQTLESIEIVLVDDGSPDRSGQIADKLALGHEEIKVVHRENGGLGPARNSGIAASSGKYIGFVDADDWVDPGMYESLVQALEDSGADICYSGIRLVRDGKVMSETENALGGSVLVGQDEIFRIRRSFYGDSVARVRDDGIPVSVCVAGYRRSMLLSGGVLFEDVRSEDILFNARAAAVASSVVVLRDVFYNYRQDIRSSITSTFKTSTFDEFEAFFEKLVEYAESEEESYRKECLLRSKKRIVDYARALGAVLVSSGEDRKTQESLLRESSSLFRVRWALDGFPIRKLTTRQALYCVALATNNARFMRGLLKLRGRIS